MKEIGHTRLKYKGEIVDVAVNDNGTITLPNGKKMKLPDEKYKALCTQIEQERMMIQPSVSIVANVVLRFSSVSLLRLLLLQRLFSLCINAIRNFSDLPLIAIK